MVYDGLIAPMGDNLLVHEQVTELRRLALSRLIEVHGQAEVARRMKRLPQQIHDMARSKSFGEKVALEMERAWSESTGGEVIDLIAPRPRDDRAPAPAGWDRLDDLGRMRVEAYISGLLAQPATSTSPEPGRFQAD
ncbi:hypothetical protein C7401_13619 [Paraburkholderia unamae]|nr:hypothetical protein C7401_13619 [Paraburkholderia unamae]